MTAQTSLYGRLTVDPQPHQPRPGTAMTSAKLAVELPCKEDPEGKATWWVGFINIAILPRVSTITDTPSRSRFRIGCSKKAVYEPYP